MAHYGACGLARCPLGVGETEVEVICPKNGSRSLTQKAEARERAQHDRREPTFTERQMHALPFGSEVSHPSTTGSSNRLAITSNAARTATVARRTL